MQWLDSDDALISKDSHEHLLEKTAIKHIEVKREKVTEDWRKTAEEGNAKTYTRV